MSKESRRPVPGMPGVQLLLPISQESLRKGSPQRFYVVVEPNGTVPLHTHSVDAVMTILDGSGFVLTQQGRERHVTLGDVVTFKANEPHGFEVSADGLKFLSENGGIADEDPNNWDIAFAA